MRKSQLKSGDTVKVITGKFRGLVDYISQINPHKQVVYLKKAFRQKYDKSTAESRQKSQPKQVMVPIHISNVVYWEE
ncbi:27709_t:CDS:1 [Racocetra persica]|uniref:27709_t:CDS:1 n=1 Tax=Racocetra persica TaxID=160502 RepID=A0ACA9RP81_9GLOM|nr:27709_t:CDS:1 [Racocetra persica]